MSDDYGSYNCSTGTPDYLKDPDSTEDYQFNWAPELDGDTISSVSWSLPDGLTQVSTSNTTTTATIFVSGGSEGSQYRIRCRVVTAGGRTWDRTIRIQVEDR
jgi:hypothetical protein